MTDAEPAPEPTVDPALARSPDGDVFATPESFGKSHAETVRSEANVAAKKMRIPANLLVFPIKKLHSLAAHRTGWSGWELDDEERQYWTTLANYFIGKYEGDIEKLELVVAGGGLLVCYATKYTEYEDWAEVHGEHAEVKDNAPPEGALRSPNTESDPKNSAPPEV